LTRATTREAALYLDLVKRALAGQLALRGYELHPGYFDGRPTVAWVNRLTESVVAGIGRVSRQDLGLVRRLPASARVRGGPWPLEAETMIGTNRLDHLQLCVEDVLDTGIPGDLIEAGVWRGGATILMRAVLAARGVTDRAVWVADSFAGLPSPDGNGHPADASIRLHTFDALNVPLEEVRAAFERYGLLDDQVRFLAGWFADTLPELRGNEWALIRLDGDLHRSTTDSLRNLYPSLADGGYVIVDDYGAVEGCRLAVDEFRRAQRIEEPMEPIDASAVFWRKGTAAR
jgi:O-methyltransferase